MSVRIRASIKVTSGAKTVAAGSVELTGKDYDDTTRVLFDLERHFNAAPGQAMRCHIHVVEEGTMRQVEGASARRTGDAADSRGDEHEPL